MRVRASDLHASRFDPVSSRCPNYSTVKDPDYFKPQIEEMHCGAAERFLAGDRSRDRQRRVVRPDDLAIPVVVVRTARCPQGLGGPRLRHGPHLRRRPRRRTQGKLRGKRALLSLTTGGPEEAYREDGFNGDMAGITAADPHAGCSSSSGSTCSRRTSCADPRT
ncbi:MAG: NAD(P)H-dependent oxidoreductase [Desulfobacterales bacterium]|nr:NAD(P)H-dependent oxidoreductase [Desulfobacterales bacterium]